MSDGNLYIDYQEQGSERESEYDHHDQSLEDEIARLVENTELRDGWVLPIEQEDMAEVYESLGRIGPVDFDEESQPDVNSGWFLDTEDIVCEYSVSRSLQCWNNH
jgi:hypothetical protein